MQQEPEWGHAWRGRRQLSGHNLSKDLSTICILTRDTLALAHNATEAASRGAREKAGERRPKASAAAGPLRHVSLESARVDVSVLMCLNVKMTLASSSLPCVFHLPWHRARSRRHRALHVQLWLRGESFGLGVIREHLNHTHQRRRKSATRRSWLSGFDGVEALASGWGSGVPGGGISKKSGREGPSTPLFATSTTRKERWKELTGTKTRKWRSLRSDE